MNEDSTERRTRLFNRLAKAGLIGSLVGFGSLAALVALPVDDNVGRVIAAVMVLLLILSVIVLVVAIAARDLPTWKQNRWWFSMGSLLIVMLYVTMALGSIVAAARGASLGQMLLGCGVFMILSFIFTNIYIHRSRTRHFNEMNSQGRYLDWNTVAAHLTQGEGTILLGPCYRVPTVWWTERKIGSLEEARAAIDSDAIITICSKQTRLSKWLKSTFPEAPIVELPTALIRFDSGI